MYELVLHCTSTVPMAASEYRTRVERSTERMFDVQMPQVCQRSPRAHCLSTWSVSQHSDSTYMPTPTQTTGLKIELHRSSSPPSVKHYHGKNMKDPSQLPLVFDSLHGSELVFFVVEVCIVACCRLADE
jgi:hypothetical protein